MFNDIHDVRIDPLVSLKLILSIDRLLHMITSHILPISLGNIELSINQRLVLILILLILVFNLKVKQFLVTNDHLIHNPIHLLHPLFIDRFDLIDIEVQIPVVIHI